MAAVEFGVKDTSDLLLSFAIFGDNRFTSGLVLPWQGIIGCILQEADVEHWMYSFYGFWQVELHNERITENFRYSVRTDIPVIKLGSRALSIDILCVKEYLVVNEVAGAGSSVPVSGGFLNGLGDKYLIL